VSGGHAVASRAEGGWWWRTLGSQEVEAVVRSKARDEAVTCSRTKVKDGRWQWCNGVWGR
jgi:hypothetical protein